mmetsp:Transcript_15705/g.20517  ORF Transcript_15705/g.20517 Transcript_15705/m.20517 type:complete len:112 (-) Transcript_15705:1468-1803(-)
MSLAGITILLMHRFVALTNMHSFGYNQLLLGRACSAGLRANLPPSQKVLWFCNCKCHPLVEVYNTPSEVYVPENTKNQVYLGMRKHLTLEMANSCQSVKHLSIIHVRGILF